MDNQFSNVLKVLRFQIETIRGPLDETDTGIFERIRDITDLNTFLDLYGFSDADSAAIINSLFRIVAIIKHGIPVENIEDEESSGIVDLYGLPDVGLIDLLI